MRRFVKLLICIGVVLCGIFSARAQTVPCPSSGTTLFFVNGVYNFTYASARQALFALESNTSAPNSASAYKYELAYNPGDGYLSDLIEGASQKLGVNTDRSLFTLWFLGEVVPDIVDQNYTLTLGLPTIAKYLPPQTTLSVLQQHVALYRAEISAGNKVIAVAHSQGNFFVNAAVEDLQNGLTFKEQASFTIVSIANPDNHIATASRSDSPVTLIEDAVIGGLVPFAMKAAYQNGTITEPNHDYSKHQFVASYLEQGYSTLISRTGDTNSLKAIRDRISHADTVTRSPSCASSTKITIQFTGVVTSAATTPPNLAPGGIVVGMPLSGTLSYDTTLIPAPVIDGPYVEYSFQNGGAKASVTLNGYTWTTGKNVFVVVIPDGSVHVQVRCALAGDLSGDFGACPQFVSGNTGGAGFNFSVGAPGSGGRFLLSTVLPISASGFNVAGLQNACCSQLVDNGPVLAYNITFATDPSSIKVTGP